MPKKITHPFHKEYTLTLHPLPVYDEGFFSCDACGETSNGFSYHCRPCSLDLHILCASMPLSVSHTSHSHNLHLVFHNPYGEKAFSCDICSLNDRTNWLYCWWWGMAKICCKGDVATGESSGGARRRRRMELQRVGIDARVKRRHLESLSDRDLDNGFESCGVGSRGDGGGNNLPKFGIAFVCGRRREMEDVVAVHPSFFRREGNDGDGGLFHFFAVYEGPGCYRSHVL